MVWKIVLFLAIKFKCKFMPISKYHIYMYVYLITKEKFIIVTFVHMNSHKVHLKNKVMIVILIKRLNVKVMSKWNEGNFVEETYNLTLFM